MTVKETNNLIKATRSFAFRKAKELSELNIFPSFIYERIKGYSLAKKIYFIILVASLPILLILLTIFIALFFQLSSQLDTKLAEKMLANRNAYNYHERQTRVYANLIADNPNLQKELLAENINIGPILRIGRQIMESVHLDRITFFDRDGIVITKAHDPTDIGQSEIKRNAVYQAVKMGVPRGVLRRTKEGLLLENVVPVFFEKEIIGAISAGYLLNYNFASRLNKLTQSHIFFVANDKILSTSLGKIESRNPDRTDFVYSERNRATTISREINLYTNDKRKSVEYAFRYLPIVTAADSLGLKSAGILVVMDQSGERLYLKLLISISTLLTFVVVCAGLLLSVKVGHNISNFAGEIGRTMNHFRDGELDSRIHIVSQDELGKVAIGFNEMAQQLQEKINEIKEANATLETRVIERTKELKEALDEVTALKEIQDADYLLSSLLLRPLIINDHDSKRIYCQFYIEQKKKFNYRGRAGDLGGDLCYATNLKFKGVTTPLTFFFNGDAMGKSSQGALGALICGVTLQIIIDRSQKYPDGLAVEPIKWLSRVYYELHHIFCVFDGSMMMSAACGLINEETNEMYYFNSEHPWTVLYRDGKARFIEAEPTTMHKLGTTLNHKPVMIRRMQLQAGDVLYLGSDGRDDLEIYRKGNYELDNDEERFLELLEQADADLDTVVGLIHESGRITDDLSLLKIGIALKEEITDDPALEEIGGVTEVDYSV